MSGAWRSRFSGPSKWQLSVIPRRHSPAELSGGQYIPLREGQLKAKHTVPTGTYCEKVSSSKRDTRHIFPQGPRTPGCGTGFLAATAETPFLFQNPDFGRLPVGCPDPGWWLVVGGGGAVLKAVVVVV